MSNEFESILTTFKAISETSKRLEKDKLLGELIKDKKAKELLKEILVYTFHPYWNYWIKVKPLPITQEKALSRNSHWYIFKELLDRLRRRVVTGDKARRDVSQAFSVIDSEFSEPWLRQIINRDLKIGMQLKSFEKHLGELVPKFCPMLAATWDKQELDMEVAIEPKLDGIRCLAIFPRKGEPTTVSRNGRPIYNTEEILEELGDLSNCIVDGELVGAGKSWGSGISGAHSKNKKVKGLQFVVFDYMDLEDWEKRKHYLTYEERRHRLQKDIIESEHVKISPILKQGKLSAKQILSLGDKCIANGLEGIIIKPLHMRYMFKRCNSWLKYKFKDTIDCKVVGRIEGNHRNKGKLGALIVEGKIGKQKFRSEVGQGFTDKDRKYFWNLPSKELTRLIIEIEHYGLTNALRLKKSNKLSAVRNGVFLRIRDDKMER